ncbi:MAG: potassium/proton antiporter [Planctomycetes bacterium]|nr:potassium/proton antiporter [Planctomycetota bacterium]
MTLVYLVVPLLLLAVVLAAVWLDRWSVPVILVALGLGIVCGSDVLNLWYFSDFHLANEVANVALVFILFQGGLATKRDDLRAVALPAGGLATWGVMLTAAALFGALHGLLGWPLEKALLLSVVISSTDAAATFSILRRQSLPKQLGSTLEIESAANDPMAILLTLVVVESLATGESKGWLVVPLLLWKFVAGPAFGWAIGRLAIAVFDRLNPQDRGYYYVLLLAIVLLSFGVTELAHGSGMLAAFTAGLVMGNRRFIYQQGIRNFSSALSTIANIGVFVLMGVLVFPKQWAGLWQDGVLLFVMLTFVARPAAVWLGTVGMRIGFRERHFLCWAGLRGAVPIVLATYPMAANIPGANDVFNLVFFAVLLSVSIQGSTLGWLAQRLRLATPSRPAHRYTLELVTMAHSELDLLTFDMPDPAGRPGPRIRDLVMPKQAVITLITRGNEVVPPTGNTRLHGWDRVTVLARPQDEAAVRDALVGPFEAPVVVAGADAASAPAKAAPPDSALEAELASLRDHVVLLGHGRVGTVLAGLLRARGTPFVVIEQDQVTATALRQAGVLALAGEAASTALLDRARIATAKLLLVTSPDPIAARVAVEYAIRANPEIEAVCRVHFDEQRELLHRFPRTQCVHGEHELAYAMARLMLKRFGLSAMESEAVVIDARRGRRDGGADHTGIVELHVPDGSPVIGRTLATLGLPRGALVITIARDGEFVVPGGATEIRTGDALLLLANADLAREVERILAGRGDAAMGA